MSTKASTKLDLETPSTKAPSEPRQDADVPVFNVSDALKMCKSSIIAVGVFSLASNLLMLTPSIYMLSAYDRVLSSGSIPTLGMLTLIMVFALVVMGGFEWIRSQVMIRVSNKFDFALSGRLYDISLKQALYSGGSNTQAAPIQDLNGLRQFVTGNGLFAFFDAPWLPIYIMVMFMFHPWYGYIAIFAAFFLMGVAVANEKLSSGPLSDANKKNQSLNAENQKVLRNAEVIQSMGMGSIVRQRWHQGHDAMLVDQTKASAISASFTAFAKSSRVMMQSLILGTGAYLAVNNEVTGGMMIAGSILLGRALAPLDQMVGVWKQFATARGQWSRLNEILNKVPQEPETMELPTPSGALLAQQMTVTAPGSRVAILQNLNFKIPAGSSVGVIGPSGSGKSTLVRAMLGIWPLVSGSMRIDGADVFSWNREHLGPFIGYLPQDIELFDGTIAENVSRFGDIDADKVVKASKIAGVHDLILSLPNGYDTELGQYQLSGGQRQRIGLARALYGDPVLVVLDEPNSNLDDAGERHLFQALRKLKERGATIVTVSHRLNILAEVDTVLMLEQGRLKAYGPRDEVLAGLAKARQPKGGQKPPVSNQQKKGDDLKGDTSSSVQAKKANESGGEA